MPNSHLLLDHSPLTILNNVSPLPCSHPACSEFCIHLKFFPEIVCKVEKLRSTFYTLHDYLKFLWAEKKDDGLLTNYLNQLKLPHWYMLHNNVYKRKDRNCLESFKLSNPGKFLSFRNAKNYFTADTCSGVNSILRIIPIPFAKR